MSKAPGVVVSVLLVAALAACTAPPTSPSPSASPSAWSSTEQARLPLPDESAAGTSIPFDGAKSITELMLWLQRPPGDWTGDVLWGNSAESADCRFEHSSTTATASPAGDRTASEALLDELVADRVPLQHPRAIAWGTSATFTPPESFDLLASLVDDDGFTVVGARVFGRYGVSYRMELHCDELEPLARALEETPDAVSAIVYTADHARPVPGALVGDYTARIPVDLGTRPHAMGETTLDADGIPVSYRVAPDDVWDFVARRFGFFGIPPNPGAESFNLDTGYLNVINQLRRGGTPWVLYAGDTVNLSAFTVTSVGRVNGEVLSGIPPDPLPPQR